MEDNLRKVYTRTIRCTFYRLKGNFFRYRVSISSIVILSSNRRAKPKISISIRVIRNLLNGFRLIENANKNSSRWDSGKRRHRNTIRD